MEFQITKKCNITSHAPNHQKNTSTGKDTNARNLRLLTSHYFTCVLLMQDYTWDALNLVKSGINYQPQLVVQDFWTIDGMIILAPDHFWPDPVVTAVNWTGLGSCTRQTSNDQGTTSGTRSCSTNGGRRWPVCEFCGVNLVTTKLWQGTLPNKNKKKLDEHQSLDPPTMTLFNELWKFEWI